MITNNVIPGHAAGVNPEPSQGLRKSFRSTRVLSAQLTGARINFLSPLRVEKKVFRDDVFEGAA